MWMIRSEGGELFETFETKKVVAIGWADLGNLTVYPTAEALADAFRHRWPDDPAGRVNNAVGVIRKFQSVIAVDDDIVTYDPGSRKYILGKITSSYIYDSQRINAEYPHIREVKWLGEVLRDTLSAAARNTLGSTLTVFRINDDVAAEIKSAVGLCNGTAPIADIGKAIESTEVFRDDEVAKSYELIKDAILALSPRNLEELVAATLRAMGYRARVTAEGPDRGVDVYASPDGLMLEEPRIKVEVKHRPGVQIGANILRSFIGALRIGDRGIFVSTGGFSREARYEAERANTPVALLNLDELCTWVVGHYERFTVEGRLILPLRRIYLPEN
jgi:restriction system protein